MSYVQTLPCRFPTKVLYPVLIPKCVPHVPTISVLANLNICQECKSRSSSVCNFLHLYVTSTLLPPNISRVTMLFPLWRSTSTSSNIIQGVVTTYRTIWCVDYAIAQAVSRRFLSAEAIVHASVSPCGICGGLSGTGAGSFWSPSVFPVDIIPPLLLILLYHLRNGQTTHKKPSSTEI